MRSKSKSDNGKTAKQTFKMIDGSWRLIFTTGDVKTQERIGGRINYFPLKAIQSFDTSSFLISNGIYLGDFAILRFFGEWSWNEELRKAPFDFDRVEVLGLSINLPKQENVKVKPFFNWIYVDDEIAVARGGGGGLALWRRNDKIE